MSYLYKARPITFHRKTIVAGVAAAIGAGSAGLSWSAELEEVVVTARQRAESSQDIPMTVQSLSGEDLRKQNIITLEDFSRAVSGLSVQTTTPGQNIIVFRGVSDGGGFLVDPTAGVYLDEQPMSHAQAAPDVYPVDLSRIEALAGPQSTLYGQTSQSGAIRIITNKPDPEAFSANIGAGVDYMSEGDAGYKVDGTVNIPLSDSVAIRLSGFSSRQAGFIDNVLGRTIVDDVFATGQGGGKDNAALVEDDFNEVDWQGARGAIRWLVNDAWTVTASANYQDLEADGFNDFDPNVGDLETVKFAEEKRTDEWYQTSLVIEGDLGFAQLVSATSYYDREVMYQHDTQSYAAYFHYSFGIYYGYALYDFGLDPTGYLTNTETNESFTQEIRLSGATDRMDWTLGGFYQDSEQFWDFYTYIDDYRNSPAFAAFNYYYPGIAPTDSWWNSYQGTDRKDKAIFGEVDYELIDDKLTLLLGGRYYEIERELTYTVERPDGRIDRPYPARTMEDDGFNPKYGLEYKVSDDVMVYGVYSEGFRVGGVNRGRCNANGCGTWPLVYDSDTLENVEFGLKSEFADGRVMFNAVYYDMTVDNQQIEVIDPANKLGTFSSQFGNAPFQVVVGNVGESTIEGFELEFRALIGDNLEIGGNYTDIMDAYVDTSPTIDEPRADAGSIPTGLEPRSQLPLMPDQTYNLYLEYSPETPILGGSVNFRVSYSHVGESLNQITDDFVSYRLPQGDYEVMDASFNLEINDWVARIYVTNLTDERGITYEDTQDFDPLWGRYSSNVVRPQTFGFSLRKFFR